ncbi:MAG TPA: hypothetical protein VNX67_07855 [Solirubrobacteraceae bacterium]|nr:hypothetical protein [Solirubrobacteraceae bacterium]
MKKLGTPESDPPSVEGRGGVSADGETDFVFDGAPAFVFPGAPDFRGGFAAEEPPCP